MILYVLYIYLRLVASASCVPRGYTTRGTRLSREPCPCGKLPHAHAPCLKTVNAQDEISITVDVGCGVESGDWSVSGDGRRMVRHKKIEFGYIEEVCLSSTSTTNQSTELRGRPRHRGGAHSLASRHCISDISAHGRGRAVRCALTPQTPRHHHRAGEAVGKHHVQRERERDARTLTRCG